MVRVQSRFGPDLVWVQWALGWVGSGSGQVGLGRVRVRSPAMKITAENTWELGGTDNTQTDTY